MFCFTNKCFKYFFLSKSLSFFINTLLQHRNNKEIHNRNIAFDQPVLNLGRSGWCFNMFYGANLAHSFCSAWFRKLYILFQSPLLAMAPHSGPPIIQGQTWNKRSVVTLSPAFLKFQQGRLSFNVINCRHAHYELDLHLINI